MSEKVVIGNATLYHGDCREVLPTIRAASCVTSPPYNLGGFHQMHGGNSAKWEYENFSDDLPEADYQAAQIEICNLVFDASTGPMFYNHKNRIANGRLISPLEWLNRTKWVVHQQVVINKGSGANVDKRRFFPVHEILLVCLKDQTGKINNDGCFTDVWNVEQTNRKDVDHPAVMPLSMARRAVSATPKGAVLDPYCGTGTTGVACAFEGRDFVGIERERKYFDIACERIARAQAQGQMFAPESAALPTQQAMEL